MQGLLREASLCARWQSKARVRLDGVGPKPIPADGEPVFGPLETIENYFVAFSHSGATLGLIAGEMLAGEIATGRAHPMLQNSAPAVSRNECKLLEFGVIGSSLAFDPLQRFPSEPVSSQLGVDNPREEGLKSCGTLDCCAPAPASSVSNHPPSASSSMQLIVVRQHLELVASMQESARILASRRRQQKAFRGVVDADRRTKILGSARYSQQRATKRYGLVISNTRGTPKRAELAFEIYGVTGGQWIEEYKGLQALSRRRSGRAQVRCGQGCGTPQEFQRSFAAKGGFFTLLPGGTGRWRRVYK